ncbi:MAG: MMPL family transporter [Acidimicrobiaceae bacterium]|nr:MMPL family transporter [Acidimicrobiaceae bacterium]
MPTENTDDSTNPPARGLARLGEACARRPWRVIGSWLAALIVIAGISGSLHATFSDNVTLSGTQANTGLVILTNNVPGIAASAGLVVFHSATPVINEQSSIVEALSKLTKVIDVTGVSNPWSSGSVSRDGLTATSTINFSVASRALPRSVVTQLNSATAAVRQAGVSVNYGGGLDQVTQPTLKDVRSEEIGFAIALLVLLFIFGSVYGALLPLLTALLSIAAGVSLLDIVASRTTFSVSAPKLALMIGLGVGIDYAVFSTTRFRQQVIDGVDPVRAAGHTTSTSGRAVLVAASTVSVAMLGLYASGIVFIGKLGLAAVFGVFTAALGAITLMPGLFGLFGRRIDRARVRKPVAESGTAGDGWHRYAAAIGRHPWTYMISGLLVLVVIATPMLSLQMGHVGDGASPSSFTSRIAYDQVASGFGPGMNGTFTIVVQLHSSSASVPSLESSLSHALHSTPDVARVTPFTASPNGKILTATLIPATGPQNVATSTLFTRLINNTLPRVLTPLGDQGYVTGATPSQIQFDQMIASRIPLIIAVVVLLAFLLIMTVFRSLLLAIKAALLNLFSIAAAYGVLVAVFQWGWGRSLLGLNENVPIESYVPMVLFAVVFGLSMDYEIFLLSRVKESWELTHDNHESVAEGLSRTGRVITAAALIMVAVFLSFVSSDLVAIKQLAIGLAASVAIDATLIRLLLVPATMYLFGDLNWWLPQPLDRLLPHVSVD